MVGYQKKEVLISVGSTAAISLSPASSSLDEVVVVGYGTQKKVNLSGAVNTVDKKLLTNRPVTSLTNALQGTVPVVAVQSRPGDVGNDLGAINVRGRGNTGTSSPLFVVDGVIVQAGDFARINPNDVESVSILKDASASAIYWSRAAYGVILVTTKKGGGSSNSMTGYNFRKLFDTKSLESSLEFDAAEDFPIIRYAEILLSYAEAKNEATGPDASIYAALNDIRDRAGMPAVSTTTYNTKEKLRELIRNERRIELAGEGHRYYDIRRWNIAAAVMKTTYDISNVPVQERVWQDKFKLMPYPQTALDRNSNLKARNKLKVIR